MRSTTDAAIYSVRLLAAIVCLHLASCVTSIEDSVSISDTIVEDQSYQNVLSANSRGAKVFNNFEMLYTVEATFLGPGMLKAVSERFQRLFGLPQPFLEEAATKTGFFVSLMQINRDAASLDNANQWSVLLTQEGKPAMRPVVIRRLADKQRWLPFFASVHTWTDDYLIVFDTALPNVTADGFVNKESIVLQFANADAQVKLVW